MTNADIVDVWLKHRSMKLSSGKRDDNLPLMPFFIMDVVYQIYCKDIKDYPCRFRLAKAKNKWRNDYAEFNREFFRPFNADQTEYIGEQMDEFGDYIRNHVVMLKSCAMELMGDSQDFNDKKVLASVAVCNVLAQAAQHLHCDMYKRRDCTGQLVGEVNVYIEGVKKATYDFAYSFVRGTRNIVTLTDSSRFMGMIDSLCRKIVQFLKDNQHETNT